MPFVCGGTRAAFEPDQAYISGTEAVGTGGGLLICDWTATASMNGNRLQVGGLKIENVKFLIVKNNLFGKSTDIFLAFRFAFVIDRETLGSKLLF